MEGIGRAAGFQARVGSKMFIVSNLKLGLTPQHYVWARGLGRAGWAFR